MKNTVRCRYSAAHEHSKNSRFRHSVFKLIPWICCVERFLPYFIWQGPRLLLFGLVFMAQI